MHRLKLLLDSCDFIGDRYSYTRVDVNIVLTADFSWSYIACCALGWVCVHTTMGWVGFAHQWVGLRWVEENVPMSKSVLPTSGVTGRTILRPECQRSRLHFTFHSSETAVILPL